MLDLKPLTRAGLFGLAMLFVLASVASAAPEPAPANPSGGAGLTANPAKTAPSGNPVKPGSTGTGRAAGQSTAHAVPAVISDAIRPGFNATTYGPNDDGSYPCVGPEAGSPSGCTPTAIPIGFNINFFGQPYSSLFLNNNGNVTFDAPQSDYTPLPILSTSRVLIAPYFSDVDTRTGPTVTFGPGTVDGHAAWGANWQGVGCFDEITTVANTFQLVLINRSDTGAGNFDMEFNEGSIQWETGQASGGDASCLGGSSARVGYSNGSTAAFELPGSGVPGSFLDNNATTGLIHGSIGSPVLGRYLFPARQGFAPTPGTVPLLSQPQRLVDTRTSGGPINTGQSRCFTVAGQAGIPADAVGVLLNVTAVSYDAPGWLTIYPGGQPVPATSTLNFQPGAYAIANGVVARIGTNGQVCVSVGTLSSSPGSSNVILDVTGYMTPASALQLPLLPQPQRLVDTRTSGGPIATGQSRCFPVAGVAGIPQDAAGVLLNVAGVSYNTRGWLTVYPGAQQVPSTSTLNVDPNAYAIANGAISRIGTNGQICVNFGTVGNTPGSSNVVMDVTGYLTSVASTQMPLLSQPQRLVDTRTSAGGGPILTGHSRCFNVAGVAGIPANAVGVVLNAAVVDYTTPGWLTLYPNGQPVPTTSSLNFDTTEYAMANSAIITIGTGGSVCVAVGTPNNIPGSSDVILDAVGYLTGVPSVTSAEAQGQPEPIRIPKPTPGR
jgi:hypothetical protein